MAAGRYGGGRYGDGNPVEASGVLAAVLKALQKPPLVYQFAAVWGRGGRAARTPALYIYIYKLQRAPLHKKVQNPVTTAQKT